MNKVKIDFGNCYGIRRMVHEFDTLGGFAFLVYAPNGSMKTSFARVFQDISKGQNPKDVYFPRRRTSFAVVDEGGEPVDPTKIFVVEPHVEGYISEKASTLMVEKGLRKEYEDIIKTVSDKANVALTALGKAAGLKNLSKVREELSITHGLDQSDIYSLLEKSFSVMTTEKDPGFGDVPYAEIFNDKALRFLSDNKVRKQLEDYVIQFNKLTESSIYFRRGLFNHNHAANVSRSLADNNYFKAQHTVMLTDKDANKREITSTREFDLAVKAEKERILSDPGLSSRFEAVDKEITRNADLRNFRTYLESRTELIPELLDIKTFRNKLWISYSFTAKWELKEFVSAYHLAKKSLGRLIKKAKEQETEWRKVVSIFHNRFEVPFEVEVVNQHNVILKDETPNFIFRYKDGDEQCEIGKELLSYLSSGEKRALYLLNVIFEIEARSAQRGKTILVLDDIADSFDYKNKYAIVEYLKDILETGKFIMLVLTHNFDFFRTVQSRLGIGRGHNCYMVIKDNGTVELRAAEYLNNPFLHWRRNLYRNRRYMLAIIPMVRNLIEYTVNTHSQDYDFLTSILHRKPESVKITMSDLARVVNCIIGTTGNYGAEKVNDVIFEEAELCIADNNPISLENKVVISIAIRLLAEDIMISRINDANTTSNIHIKQTRKLYSIFKEMFPEDLETIAILDRVMLMIPETIHLNSFMYEPIIDISNEHLISLYSELKAIK